MKEKQETKLCRHCKTEIPAGAKVCPNCKKKQGAFMKWGIIGILALAIMGSMTNNDKDKAKDSDTKTVDNSLENNGIQESVEPSKSETDTMPSTTIQPVDEIAKDDALILDFSAYSTSYENIDISNLTVQHGELLSVIYNDGIVTVKTKIKPSYSNKATINQNYFNVADLVKNHGFDTCEKLSYWAVADMTNGEESKCISFDINKEILTELYNGNIAENLLGDYATDLWILPSLLN